MFDRTDIDEFYYYYFNGLKSVLESGLEISESDWAAMRDHRFRYKVYVDGIYVILYEEWLFGLMWFLVHRDDKMLIQYRKVDILFSWLLFNRWKDGKYNGEGV